MVLDWLSTARKSIIIFLSLLCFDYPQAFLTLFPKEDDSLFVTTNDCVVEGKLHQHHYSANDRLTDQGGFQLGSDFLVI